MGWLYKKFMYVLKNALRILKYLLKRDTLLQMYKTFILPLFEYACEVWDGCSAFESNFLEKITGLPSYQNSDSLYFETGLETLSDRRNRRKLQLLYKMKFGLTSEFLNTILPYSLTNFSISS